RPKNWSAQRDKARMDAMLAAETKPIDPQYLALRFTETLPRDAVVVDEGLVSTYALPRLLPLRGPRDYYGLASGGLGFAVPGAAGSSRRTSRPRCARRSRAARRTWSTCASPTASVAEKRKW